MHPNRDVQLQNNLDKYDPNLSSHNMNETLKPQTTAADSKVANHLAANKAWNFRQTDSSQTVNKAFKLHGTVCWLRIHVKYQTLFPSEINLKIKTKKCVVCVIVMISKNVCYKWKCYKDEG